MGKLKQLLQENVILFFLPMMEAIYILSVISRLNNTFRESTSVQLFQKYHVRVGDTLVKIADNCPIGKKTFRVGDQAAISFRSEGTVKSLAQISLWSFLAWIGLPIITQ